MASTNHTTNYNLSQYVGSDKPTYLQDYNGDMNKIDAQMKTNADNIATAISGVESATTTSNQAVATANQAQTTANGASQTAQSASQIATNAQSTANSALSTATASQTTANQVASDLSAFEQKLNFTHFDTLSVTTNNGTISSQDLKVASNEDGDVAKIYGICSISGSTNIATLTGTSRLRPTTQITINGAGILYTRTNDGQISRTGNMVDITIATNGNITITSNFSWGDYKQYYLFPCMLFLKDFGDTPTPEE